MNVNNQDKGKVRWYKKIILSSLLSLLVSSNLCLAQDVIKVVDFDESSGLVTDALPFDRPLILRYSSTEQLLIESIGLIQFDKKHSQEYYRNLFDGGELFSGISDGRFLYNILKSSMSVGSDDKGIKYQLNIYLPALDPNMFYDVVYLRKPSLAEANEYLKLFQMYYDDKEIITSRFQTQLKFINELKKPFQHKIMSGPTAGDLDIAPLVNMYGTVLRAEFAKLAAAAAADKATIQTNIISIIRLYKDPADSHLLIFGKSLGASTTYFSFDTRSKFTITPDFGYVYYGFQDGFQGMTPYIGAQIEFRYYDKNMPFRLIPNKKLMHYLSFTTGLTLASLKEQNRREDFFSGKSMLIGLGIRLSNSVRFTFGGVLFNKLDPNPLVDNKTLAITPFTGISVDLKLQSLFGDLASLVPINRR